MEGTFNQFSQPLWHSSILNMDGSSVLNMISTCVQRKEAVTTWRECVCIAHTSGTTPDFTPTLITLLNIKYKLCPVIHTTD